MSQTVGLFVQDLSFGGAERAMTTLADGLNSHGYEVDFITGDLDGEMGSSIPATATTIELDTARALESIRPLATYLSRDEPAVLCSALTHANVTTILASLLASSCTTVIVTEHSPPGTRTFENPRGRLVLESTRLVYPFADGIVGVSEEITDSFRGRSIRSGPDYRTIHNPIPVADIQWQATHPVSHHWISKDEPCLITAGRLTEVKDYKTLLHSIERITQDHTVRLLILGDGPHRNALEEVTHRLGIEEYVEFLGYVENPYKYMQRADLFVLSSRSEGLPTVLIESLACGCPVVTTNCSSGVREILGDGQYGLLAPVGDSAQLAERILEGLARDYDQNVLRSRAEDFDIQSAVTEYIKLFGLQ